VEPVDAYSDDRLGAATKGLLALPDEPESLGEIIAVTFEAQQALDALLNSGLEHSKSSGLDLRRPIGGLVSDATEDKKIDWNKPPSPWRISNMKRMVRDLDTILIRECPTLPLFFIPQKGLHRTADLIKQADLVFPEEVRKLLPGNAVDEIRQAGKALAFDMFTSYAFHMMRAAEILIRNLVRDYYRNALKDSQRNLGQYVKLLADNGADPELVRFLDELVRVERNEGIHPEKLLSEVDAEVIVTAARGAIIAAVRDLNNRSFYDSLVPAIAPPIAPDLQAVAAGA